MNVETKSFCWATEYVFTCIVSLAPGAVANRWFIGQPLGVVYYNYYR